MITKLKQIKDERGKLIVFEKDNNLTFDLKRTYFIYYKSSLDRGFHAHYNTNQLLVCLNGTVKIVLDDGFKNKEITHTGLVELLHNNSLIDVRWVKNIGSFRKLLPLLKEKWEKDCFIITIDDDTLYHEDLIFNLLNDYNKYKCVIGYRGVTPPDACLK